MKWMNPLKLLLILLSAVAVNHAFGQSDNSGPVSASDQQIQEQDLTGKRGQKVDLFTGSFDYLYSHPLWRPRAERFRTISCADVFFRRRG